MSIEEGARKSLIPDRGLLQAVVLLRPDLRSKLDRFSAVAFLIGKLRADTRIAELVAKARMATLRDREILERTGPGSFSFPAPL
jgi:hypothetical protein